MARSTVYGARVYFLATSEGGRRQDLPGMLHVPMRIGGEYLDCRLALTGSPLHPLGRWYNVTIEFLSPEFARDAMARGLEFELWEGKTIGRGRITDVPEGPA